MIVRANYIVEILTATPRRLTTYTGRTADGRRGVIIGGQYYKAAIVEWPEIGESDTTAPAVISLSIGNAKNEVLDLYTDASNFRKPVTITKIEVAGEWDEAFAPTFTLTPWFSGLTGKPRLRGERLELECNAVFGRRGTSPRTKSRSLMVDHQPIVEGQKITIAVRE